MHKCINIPMPKERIIRKNLQAKFKYICLKKKRKYLYSVVKKLAVSQSCRESNGTEWKIGTHIFLLFVSFLNHDNLSNEYRLFYLKLIIVTMRGSFRMGGPGQLHRELLFKCKSNCFHKNYPYFTSTTLV